MAVIKVGIYKITNLCNGKIYIGQSNNIYRRWKDHRCNSKNTNSADYDSVLHRAFRKYGVNNFSFDIIEECNLKDLNDREIYWIEYYDSTNLSIGYNLTTGGCGNRTWNIKDDDMLITLSQNGYSIQEISQIMCRSYDSIKQRRVHLCVTNNNNWTEKEIILLREMFINNMNVDNIAIVLNKTPAAIRHKLNRLNLFYKTKWAQQEEQQLFKYVGEGKTNKEISMLMNRTYLSIKSKRHELRQRAQEDK